MSKLAKLFGAVVFGLVFVAVIAVLLAFPTMWLWNDVCTSVLGLRTITLWQALEINLLSGMLFKANSNSSKESGKR